jgi:hypothetical protein
MGKANVRVCLPTTVRKLEPVQVLEAGDQFDLDALRQAVLLGQFQEPLRDLIGQLGAWRKGRSCPCSGRPRDGGPRA